MCEEECRSSRSSVSSTIALKSPQHGYHPGSTNPRQVREQPRKQRWTLSRHRSKLPDGSRPPTRFCQSSRRPSTSGLSALARNHPCRFPPLAQPTYQPGVQPPCLLPSVTRVAYVCAHEWQCVCVSDFSE